MVNGKLSIEFIVNTTINKKAGSMSLSGYATGISVYGVSGYDSLDNTITDVSYPDSSTNCGNIRIRVTTSKTNSLGNFTPAFVYISSSNCVLTVGSWS